MIIFTKNQNLNFFFFGGGAVDGQTMKQAQTNLLRQLRSMGHNNAQMYKVWP